VKWKLNGCNFQLDLCIKAHGVGSCSLQKKKPMENQSACEDHDFPWLLLKNIILTKDNLIWRGIQEITNVIFALGMKL